MNTDEKYAVRIQPVITFSEIVSTNYPAEISNPSVISWRDGNEIKFQLILLHFREPLLEDADTFIHSDVQREMDQTSGQVHLTFHLRFVEEPHSKLSMTIIEGSIGEKADDVQLHFEYKDSHKKSDNPTTNPRGTISVPKRVKKSNA